MKLKADAFFCFAYGGSSWTYGGSDGLGLQETGAVWARGLQAVADLAKWFLTYDKTTSLKALVWVQGGSLTTNTLAANLDDLTKLIVAGSAVGYDDFYIAIRGAVAEWTTIEGYYGTEAQLQFCRANANGHTWATYPWYMLGLMSVNGGDTGNIHIDKKGLVIFGEWNGYAEVMVEKFGIFNPLWLHRTKAINVTGQVVTLTLERPTGIDFRFAPLVSDTTFIEAALYDGFRVKRSATDLTIGARTFGVDTDGDPTISFTITEMLSSGNVLEISYAWYGPGAAVLTHGGVWGNILMRGPRSLCRADIQDARLDAPLCPFKEIKTL